MRIDGAAVFAVGVIASVIIGVIVLCVFAYNESVERQNWLNSNCKIIGKVSGSSTVATGVSSNGNVTVTPVYIPGKTGYQCNDGLTYWE